VVPLINWPAGVSSYCGFSNALIEAKAPWKIAKEETEETARFLAALFYGLAESFASSHFSFARVAESGHGMFDQLNWKMELSGKEERFRA